MIPLSIPLAIPYLIPAAVPIPIPGPVPLTPAAHTLLYCSNERHPVVVDADLLLAVVGAVARVVAPGAHVVSLVRVQLFEKGPPRVEDRVINPGVSGAGTGTSTSATTAR